MSKIAYFDCFSGISGDMIIGALLDAGLDFKLFTAELEKLRLSGYEPKYRKVMKQNIASTKFDVMCSESAPLRHLSDLIRIVDDSGLDAETVGKAKEVFLTIAKAEAKIHNQPLTKVHFHEIGAIDTIVDVVGSLVGLKLLGVERVYASKVNVGTGFVEFSHGKFPVPAPATAEILRNVPTYATETNAEVITPTGASIITTLAEEFTPMPQMVTEAIGYGAGSHDLPQPNVLRVFIGDLVESRNSAMETICVLETNIDDMNPQVYGHVMVRLFDEGALDVYVGNVQMKKGRPGNTLTVLCEPASEAKVTKLIFEETTSLGVRRRLEERTVLRREVKQVDSKFGPISVKVSSLDGKILNATPEYDQCRQAAKENKVPLKEIYREVTRALGEIF
jgi:uncharacterized protein (TIGR00299 family) protein